VLLGLCLPLLQACAGNGQGLDANGRPIGESGGSGSVPLSADLSSIEANVFTPICSKCHIGGGAPEGLRLDSADAYNLLVGVPSTEVPSILRVKPGDPDNSYIIQKLEGHAAVGAQMPLGGPYLSTATIGFIRQWISNGAPPASGAASGSINATPDFVVKAIVPDGSEPVAQSPPQISVAFSRELDGNELALLSARVESMDGISTVTARISLASGNSKVLLITPDEKLAPGTYRVMLRSPVTPQVSDLSGRTLALGKQSQNGESELVQFEVEVLP
jgi:methionine-rich copper-binding protein CopC